MKKRVIVTTLDKFKYTKEAKGIKKGSLRSLDKKGVIDVTNRITPTKKVEIIFKDNINRKPSIVVDQRLGCRVISRVDGVKTLKEMSEEI